MEDSETADHHFDEDYIRKEKRQEELLYQFIENRETLGRVISARNYISTFSKECQGAAM